jgi:hypothetical protein
VSFIEPIALAGLIAVALPVLIHLIHKRKAPRKSFPAFAFLIESQNQATGRRRVRQRLLMALRIAVLATLAIAMAKPFLVVETEGPVRSSSRLPASVLLLVDTSSSMSLDGVWERVTDRVDKEIDGLRSWDEIAVLTTTDEADMRRTDWTSDRAALREAFSHVQPSHLSTDIGEVFKEAMERLRSRSQPVKRVVVISDFYRGGFRPSELRPDDSWDFDVEAYDVSDGQVRANLSVVDVTLDNVGERGEGLWKIRATVENFDDRDATVAALRLVVGGAVVSEGQLELAPGTTVAHSFEYRAPPHKGDLQGHVEVVDEDGLAIDNRFDFVLTTRREVRVLVVNGAPSSQIYEDETFFLERALRPSKESRSEVASVSTTREGFERRSLAEFDVVVLANLAYVSPGKAQELEAYVRGGGGLLITMGNHVDPVQYNARLAGLLPKKLRGVKHLARAGDADAAMKTTSFGRYSFAHPVLHVFRRASNAVLYGARVYGYMLLEPAALDDVTTVLSFGDRSPALLDRKVGDGRVLLWTTSLDRGWTDAPIRPVYLPLVRQMVAYLARRSNTLSEQRPVVGESFSFSLPETALERVVVRRPDGVREVLSELDKAVHFVPTIRGQYRVFIQRKGENEEHFSAADFVANLSRSESALLPIEAAHLEWRDHRRVGKYSGSDHGEQRQHLWPILLFVLTLLLLAETLVGLRRDVQRRLKAFFSSERSIDLDGF